MLTNIKYNLIFELMDNNHHENSFQLSYEFITFIWYRIWESDLRYTYM